MPADVAAAFETYPLAARARLLEVRRLIFETAAATPGVGPLTETLKWKEPAYLTAVSGSGSTIRLGWPRSMPNRCAVYLNCKTTLVDTFRGFAPDGLAFQGNRAILMAVDCPLPRDALTTCLALALTYHHAKRRAA